jgi:hypothetical protein
MMHLNARRTQTGVCCGELAKAVPERSNHPGKPLADGRQGAQPGLVLPGTGRHEHGIALEIYYRQMVIRL